jgi:transposase
MEAISQSNPKQTQKLLSIIEQLQLENQQLRSANESSQLENETLKQKINWFEEQFKLARHRQFGKKSEAANNVQGNLFDDLEETSDASAEAESERETITYTRKKKSKGRNIDTTKLPREQQLHDLPEEEKCCANCDNQMKQFGEDVTETLEYIPETIKVIEHVTPKYSCTTCNTAKQAKRPENPIPKSMASSSLLTEIIISKYENHIPLYRRSKMFAKRGIDIPDNTLGNWVLQCGEVLAPLGEALWEQTLNLNYLQVDETPVKVLSDDKKGFMWAYHSPKQNNRFIIFDYNISRAGAVVQNRLNNFKGILQTDGFSGYNYFRESEHIINLGCWDHARRKFVDAQKASGKTGKGLAAKAINMIGKLYGVEQQIKNLTRDERKQRRQEDSKPLLEDFHKWLLEYKSKVPAQSSLGKALIYANNQWQYLIKYIDYGEAHIANNLVENLIRPFALGRRNWLFVGNERGGKAAALLYSLIQSCQLNNINARKYLTYVLSQAQLIRRDQIDIKSLLPQFISKDLLA